MNKTVYTVTYWDSDMEPIITVFDNLEAATKCKEYFSNTCVDLNETVLYSNFVPKSYNMKG